jgi:hypothetical protein
MQGPETLYCGRPSKNVTLFRGYFFVHCKISNMLTCDIKYNVISKMLLYQPVQSFEHFPLLNVKLVSNTFDSYCIHIYIACCCIKLLDRNCNKRTKLHRTHTLNK